MENSIPVLPEELVTEILSRLPVKSLLKFMCVSKSWLALISSPEFVKTHLSLNANNNEYTCHKVMMFERTAYTFRDCSVSSLFNNSFRDCSVSSLFNNSSIRANNLDYPRQVPCCFNMVGSVNGLICLVSQLKEFFLWNPSIRKYKKLSDCKTKTNFVYSVYGFGYDEFHDDYKVVVIFIIGRDDFSLQIEVKEYSLKIDSWRMVDNCPSITPLQQSGMFVNGKLHWVSVIDLKQSIISFDLAYGKWGEMELPCYWKGGRGEVLSLGSDRLVFCDYDETYMLDVWLMKEYGVKESWMKMFTIKISKDQLVYGFLGQRRVHMASGSEILVVFGSSFMIYNTKGDPLRSSKIIEANNWDEAEIYIESLVCPFSTVGTEDATKMGLKSSGCGTMK
ncbi:F-box/kelch-repeat protein At3g23880-like [Solanum verrucosum]|uniref:F-box/kelch-repeat protein At3g23880-like n=1 Tax=Solanum verrucosum TaxID=315347 RepID=UPI0020D0ED03|nr:F-box/kelch-repeat protein At3g23880-like [Solanum verrucosum]